MRLRESTARAVIVALGIALAGWLAGRGFARGRTSERIVSVKGISEREVQSDLALWPLRVVATGDDLGRVQSRIAGDVQQVRTFLARHGVDSSAAELQRLDVTDAFANQYQDASRVTSRYVIRQTIMVRSENPETILRASREVGQLVGGGVVLESGGEYGSGGPTFLFTKLNDLKPAMIGEATARAHEAAERFAQDSRSSLGGIRRASQGVFEILPRDQAPGVQAESQLFKTVRVVSTIEYLLQD
ncbi:MAG: SIMPL domain-containing protein [Gemmatimonadaceae bacterium]